MCPISTDIIIYERSHKNYMIILTGSSYFKIVFTLLTKSITVEIRHFGIYIEQRNLEQKHNLSLRIFFALIQIFKSFFNLVLIYIMEPGFLASGKSIEAELGMSMGLGSFIYREFPRPKSTTEARSKAKPALKAMKSLEKF